MTRHVVDRGPNGKWLPRCAVDLQEWPCDALERDRFVKEVADAILVAAKEDGRRPITDGFEWYGSALEMAEGIVEVLRRR